MQALCGGERLAMLLERAFLTRDELLFKVLRNLSQQAEAATKAGFLPYLDQLALLLQVPCPCWLCSPMTVSVDRCSFTQALLVHALSHSCSTLLMRASTPTFLLTHTQACIHLPAQIWS